MYYLTGVSPWTPWGSCSKTCGIDGKQERTRECYLHNIGGNKCGAKALKQSQPCNTTKCPGTFLTDLVSDCNDLRRLHCILHYTKIRENTEKNTEKCLQKVFEKSQ